MRDRRKVAMTSNTSAADEMPIQACQIYLRRVGTPPQNCRGAFAGELVRESTTISCPIRLKGNLAITQQSWLHWRKRTRNKVGGAEALLWNCRPMASHPSHGHTGIGRGLRIEGKRRWWGCPCVEATPLLRRWNPFRTWSAMAPRAGAARSSWSHRKASSSRSTPLPFSRDETEHVATRVGPTIWCLSRVII